MNVGGPTIGNQLARLQRPEAAPAAATPAAPATGGRGNGRGRGGAPSTGSGRAGRLRRSCGWRRGSRCYPGAGEDEQDDSEVVAGLVGSGGGGLTALISRRAKATSSRPGCCSTPTARTSTTNKPGPAGRRCWSQPRTGTISSANYSSIAAQTSVWRTIMDGLRFISPPTIGTSKAVIIPFRNRIWIIWNSSGCFSTTARR